MSTDPAGLCGGGGSGAGNNSDLWGGGGSFAAPATVSPVSQDCDDLGTSGGEGDFILKFFLSDS